MLQKNHHVAHSGRENWILIFRQLFMGTRSVRLRLIVALILRLNPT